MQRKEIQLNEYCVCVHDTAVIKDIYQIMTGSIASWDSERGHCYHDISRQTQLWYFIARCFFYHTVIHIKTMCGCIADIKWGPIELFNWHFTCRFSFVLKSFWCWCLEDRIWWVMVLLLPIECLESLFKIFFLFWYTHCCLHSQCLSNWGWLL